MVVPAAFGHARPRRNLLRQGLSVLVHPHHARLRRHGHVVFRGIEHRLPHKLAVLQDFSPAALRVVVPVHHQRLSGRVHPVVVEIPAHGEVPAPELALQLRIRAQQRRVIHQLRAEKVFRILHIRHSRLPEQIQQIHPPDGDVPQPAELSSVPEHTVHRAPGLELVPPRRRVRPLELVLLQNHRQNPRQLRCLLAVARLAREHRRLRVAVHRVRVLREDAVDEPAARRLRIVRIAAPPLLFHLLPVAQLPELLVVDDAPLELNLPLAILLEDLRRAPDLLAPDPRRQDLRLLHTVPPSPAAFPAAGRYNSRRASPHPLHPVLHVPVHQPKKLKKFHAPNRPT